jgi:hypothetical protein
MNCEKAKQILVDYSEGSLGEGKRRAVEGHLSNCEACKGELEQIESLKESVLSLESPERDAEFWRRFENKLSQKLNEEETIAGTLGFRRRATLPLAAAASVALLAVISLLIFGLQNFRPAPAPQLATETTEGDEIDSILLEMDALDEDIFSDTLLAQVAFSNGDIEQEEEDMFLLVEEDLAAVPDEIVLYDIYEPTMDDLLEELSDEEFEDVFDGLTSI